MVSNQNMHLGRLRPCFYVLLLPCATLVIFLPRRRVYTYADGFKLRPRRQQPTAACFTFSTTGNFRSRKWHDTRDGTIRRAPAPQSPGTPPRQQSHQKVREGGSSGDANSSAGVAATAMANAREESGRVGEDWSENAMLKDEVSQGQEGLMVRSKGTESLPQGEEGSTKKARFVYSFGPLPFGGRAALSKVAGTRCATRTSVGARHCAWTLPTTDLLCGAESGHQSHLGCSNQTYE